MKEHGNKLTTRYENIVKHRDLIEEQKRLLNQNQDKISVLDNRTRRDKEQLKEEIQEINQLTKRDIEQENDTRQKQFDFLENEIKSGSTKHNNEIKAVEENFNNLVSSEIQKLRDFVNNQTSEAQAHRDNLQEIYDEKLDKIKDTCAHYFTSYEQHLIYQQDLVKALEKRQE